MKNDNTYSNKVNRLGRVSTILCVLAMLSVPLVMMIAYQVSLDYRSILNAINELSAFLIIGIVEVVSYAPILGSGATYLAFITGNVGNMKLPAAISGLAIAEVEQGSEEGDVVTTIAVSASSMVTTLIIFIGMLFLSQLLPFLEAEVLQPAFAYMLPALMGAFAIPFIKKQPKEMLVPAIAMLIIIILPFFGIVIPEYLKTPIVILISIGWSYLIFNQSKKTKLKEEK